MAKIIELKILPEHFAAVKRGVKKSELRYNDRDYAVGDMLILREYTGTEYTGRRICVGFDFFRTDLKCENVSKLFLPW